MTAHTHRAFTPGCYRCDLGRDEEIAVIAEDYFDEEIAPGLVTSGVPVEAVRLMRLKYVSDARLNPEAVQQLYEYADARARGLPVTLTEFLLARIAEDEAAASLAKWPYGKDRSEAPPWPTERQWSRQLSSDEGPLLGRMSPERVLAECEAKRQIVTACAQVSDQASSEATLNEMFAIDGCRFTLCQLAAVYADHPDYRQEWRP